MSNRQVFPLVAACAWLVPTSVGCGGSTDAPKSTIEPKSTATAIAATTVAPPPALVLPAKVARLVELVPQDASIVAHFQAEGLITPGLDGKTPTLSRQSLAAALAKESGLSTSLVGELLGAVEETVFFAKPVDYATNPLGTSCLASRIQNEQRFDSLLEQLSASRTTDGRLEMPRAQGQLNGVWMASPRVVLVCNNVDLFHRALGVGRGDTPSFATSNRYADKIEKETWAYVDLHDLVGREKPGMAQGSQLFAVLPRNAPSVIDLSFSGRGDEYPQLANVLAATDHATLAQLPQGPMAVLGLSLDRVKGKTIASLVSEMERVGGKGLSASLAEALNAFGLDFATLDLAMGSQVAVGVYVDPKVSTHARNPMKNMAVLAVLPTANEAAAKKVWQGIAGVLKKKSRGRFTFAGESATMDEHDGTRLRIERKKGMILLSFGEDKFATELASKYAAPKGTLRSDADFEAARSSAKPSHLMAHVDVPSLLGIVGVPLNENIFGSTQNKIELLTLTFLPAERGIDVHLHTPADTIGVASALAIFSVNRYLKSAKSSEAKNTVGRIARHAAEAFEREDISPTNPTVALHKLCGSAIAVPAQVPAAKKYMPATDEGYDFHTGSKDTGWRCLRFDVTEPMYYQYEYRVGGNYKGPARGGPDPGPDGFEVSAEGDLDGDGKTSLFTLIGQIQNDQLVRSTQIFIVDEFE